MSRAHLALVVILAGAVSSGPPFSSKSFSAESREPDRDGRAALIARAQVWSPTDIASIDMLKGPADKGAFGFRETVRCDYVNKKLTGHSPKFACRLNPDDELKVKYGGNNGEVYGEVAATRFLWALGFAADRMYPVRVICRGCPKEFNGIEREGNESIFDPAAIERKMPGREFSPEGWSWKEIDLIDESAGGASRAQVDALKLAAVFLQHADTKSQQQRLLCLGEPAGEGTPACERPGMMLNDLGLTFGRSNMGNINAIGSVNLIEWSKMPIWKDDSSCVGNLPKSFTGTLRDPVISEGGRQFLAGLLMQLSDAQIHDLFHAARVHLRLRSPGHVDSGFATIDEWVSVFKEKRAEIVNRRCPGAPTPTAETGSQKPSA
jgi:hypothetical protein